MPNSPIHLLPAAVDIFDTDLFVLEQNEVAKKLTGRLLIEWLTRIADGHGGISNIEKTGTIGLVDSYRITLADNNVFDFNVTNGKQGDRGDPGDPGPKGDPATIVEQSVTYQSGTSGTNAPTGEWKEIIPPVPMGTYLWTRFHVKFNTGNPITMYSVSRMGQDGLGTIRTVCGQEADVNGNVSITADQVGALPQSGGMMGGNVDMSGYKVTGLPTPSESGDAVPLGCFANSNVIVWANKSLAEFTPKTINVTNHNGGDRMVVLFAVGSNDSRMVSSGELYSANEISRITYFVNAPVKETTGAFQFAVRNFTVTWKNNNISVNFASAKIGTQTANEYLIPQYVIVIRNTPMRSIDSTANELGMLELTEVSNAAVTMVVDGEEYGIETITLNDYPTDDTYDFTVL